MGFAGFITVKYSASVEPAFGKWAGGVALSNPFKIILGPLLACFFVGSSHAMGRILWTRLGGSIEFPTPGAEFTLLSAVGIAFQAVIGWVLLAVGWLPGGLLFILGIVAILAELTPTVDNLRSTLSPPSSEGDAFSRKTLTWLMALPLIFLSVTPFTWGIPELPGYLTDPAASFKLALGHIPLGLGIPLYSIYSTIGGPWAANAVTLGLTWLIILMILDTALRLFASRPAGLLGAILYLCIPFQYLLLSAPSWDIVLAFFLVASYSALVWFLFEGKFEAIPLAALLLGLALSVSARGIIFAGIFFLYVIISCIKQFAVRPLRAVAVIVTFIISTALGASLLAVQNNYLTGNWLYPIFTNPQNAIEFKIPEPAAPKWPDYRVSKAKPIPADTLIGVDFPTEYGSFPGVGYKMTMSTDGDLSAGPQGLGPFFMAFIPGILLLMITRRHTLQAWTLILLLLGGYLFWAYAGRIVSLYMLYAIFPFQALITGYIIDRLYLLSKLEEKRKMSYIFLILFIPAALLTFLWICPGFGL